MCLVTGELWTVQSLEGIGEANAASTVSSSTLLFTLLYSTLLFTLLNSTLLQQHCPSHLCLNDAGIVVQVGNDASQFVGPIMLNLLLRLCHHHGS